MYEFSKSKIAKARVRKKLSQRELAELVGVPYVTWMFRELWCSQRKKIVCFSR